MLVAHPGGDGQAAVEQADGVADVGGFALVVEGPVAEHAEGAGVQVLAVDLEVHVLLDQAGAEHPGLADRVAVDGQAQARLAAPDAEVARCVLQGGGGGVGSERQADDEVAVAVVGEVGPAELHAVEGAEAAEVLIPGGPDAVGVALEAVEVAGRLARIVPVVGHAERAGQVHVGDVALHAEAQAACVVDVPLAAQAVVLYRGLGVLAAVLAVEGVEIELQGETVGDPAAGADVAVEQLATAGGEGDALLQGGFPLLWDRRADEVDHPADVVRAVLHRGAAAHHVDALDGGQGLREQRQAGLPVGAEGQRNAVGQCLHAAAAAFVQAAHGQLRQHAGAGLVEDLHPRHPLQGIVQTAHAGLLEILRLDHAAAAGVGAHFLVAGPAQHVALDDEGGKGEIVVR
ncbi:hypothetical protein D3C75_669070 [compost metagenome]